MLTKLKLSAVLAALIVAPAGAMAQEWPERPVRILVPFGAGGAADTLARLVAEDLSKTFGQQFVVENVTGAGGTIGVTQVANAEADGYTFGVNNISTTVIAPAINPNVTYDPATDFSFIAMLGGSPTVWVVNPDLGITNVEELVAYAEAADVAPGYGSPGAGTLSHLIALKYFDDAGVAMEHIAYGGAEQAVLDVVAGHIPMASGTLSTARAQIDAGNVLPIALSTEERDPTLPDLQTFAELGHPELTSTTWFGFIGPAGVDQEIVDKLNAEINRILELPASVERLAPEGLIGDRMTAAEFTAYQNEQAALWGPIAASAELEQ